MRQCSIDLWVRRRRLDAWIARAPRKKRRWPKTRSIDVTAYKDLVHNYVVLHRPRRHGMPGEVFA